MSQVGRTTAITEVIMAILEGGLRTAAVVDEGGKLIGVITEGDVLRAVARGAGPGITAQSLMNVSPGFIVDPTDDKELVRHLLDLGRIAVPVLDSEGHYLRLESTPAAVARMISR